MSATLKEISDQHRNQRKRRKVEKTKASHSSLSRLGPDIIKHIASFLNDYDFMKFGQASRALIFTPCKDDLKKRVKAYKVKKGLLPHVSVYTLENGRPDPIQRFFDSIDFEIDDSPDFEINMILTKTPFSEGYYSKEFHEFVFFRQYRNISALQLAAVSGDRFLLDNFLEPILKKEHKDKNRVLALQQLKEVHQRITNQDTLLNAANAITEIEYGENDVDKANARLRLVEIQQSAEFQKLMKEFINEMDELRRQISDKVEKIPEMEELRRQIAKKEAKMQKREGSSSSSGALVKPKIQKQEAKVTAENTLIQYADEAEVLEPVLNLLKAYVYYYLQCPQLKSQNNLARIEQLWGYIGEWHKRLPYYFKQAFAEKKPFSDPLPLLLTTFKTSPSRAICQSWGGEPFEFDELGCATNGAMWRGGGGLTSGQPWGGWPGSAYLVRRDMTVFAHLYKLLITGLGNKIEQLKDPESENTQAQNSLR